MSLCWLTLDTAPWMWYVDSSGRTEQICKTYFPSSNFTVSTRYFSTRNKFDISSVRP